MRIKTKAFALVAGLTLISIVIAGLGVDAMRTYHRNVEELRLASVRAYNGERLNRLVTAVVMDSRGVYMGPNVRDVRQFADGMRRTLSEIDSLLAEWEPVVHPEDRSLFEGVQRSAAEFKAFRTETARLGTEVSPQAANEQGNNETAENEALGLAAGGQNPAEKDIALAVLGRRLHRQPAIGDDAAEQIAQVMCQPMSRLQPCLSRRGLICRNGTQASVDSRKGLRRNLVLEHGIRGAQ